MLKFYVMLWLDILILQPIKFPIIWLLKLLWFPAIKEQASKKDYIFNKDEIRNKLIGLDDKIKNLYMNKLLEDDDHLKFIGLLYFTFGNIVGQNTNFKDTSIWDYAMSCISDDGIIGRYPVGHPERNKVKNFSGDMFSGYGPLLVKKFFHEKGVGVKDSDLIKLKKFLYNTIFVDRPFMFAHPATGNKKGQDRGFLFPIWTVPSDIMTCMFLLAIAELIDPDEKRYGKMYRRFKRWYAPILWIGAGNPSVFFWRIRFMSWFVHHSKMFIYAAGRELTGDTCFYLAARDLYYKYNEWSLDVVSVWLTNMCEEKNIKDKEIEHLGFLVNGLLPDKGTVEYKGDTKKIFTIKSFSLETINGEWPLYNQLSHKYVWENNPLVTNLADDNRRKEWSFDGLISLGLIRNSIDKLLK